MTSSHREGLTIWFLIFFLFSGNIYGQLPSRDLFNIIFENDYNDDVLGNYTNSDFAEDWNKPAHATVDATQKIDILKDITNNTPYMRVNFKQGTYGLVGNGCYWYSALPNCNEIYFSYDIRFKPGFEWVIGGKIPGVIGGDTEAGAFPKPEDGFSARVMWKENGRPVSYVYHHDQSTIYGDSYFWGNFAFSSGKWYNITLRIVLNTPGVKNGIMEGFVDGALMFQKTNFRFRTLESIKIENMSISSFFGGGSDDWAAMRDEWIDFDNFIAFTYASTLPNVPTGNSSSSSDKELIHPYRAIPDSEWKKSLKIVNKTLTEINLSWTDYPVPMNYVLERKDEGNSTFAPITTLTYGTISYIDKNLQPDKTYVYRLKAGSSLSNQLTVITKAVVVPNTPQSVTITDILKTGLTLHWIDNSSNETGFKIERSISPSGDFYEIGTTAANITFFQDKTLQPGTTYYYRIRAFNNDGNSDYAVVISGSTLELQIPRAPSDLSPVRIEHTKASLLWNDNSDNESRFVLERTKSNYPEEKTIIELSADYESYTDEELDMGCTYQYRIKASNEDGDSEWSNLIEILTPKLLPPDAPTNLKSVKITDRSISVQWEDKSDNEEGFILTRLTAYDLSDSININLGANQTTFTDSSLYSSTTFIYTIRAVNPAGVSSCSNKSISTTLSKAELNRVMDGLVAYYNFGYNPDLIVFDQSGYEDPVDLKIFDHSAINWNTDNTLDILSKTSLVSIVPAEKIVRAVKSTNEVTFECWVKPQEPDPYEISRIISLGHNDDDLGFVLDQNREGDDSHKCLNYCVRMQTSSTVLSGYPTYHSDNKVTYINLMHLVYTRDKLGTETIYINGEPAAKGFRPNDLSTWKEDYFLRFANESDMSHTWKGSFFSVAIYNKALSLHEILKNFSAGAFDENREDFSYEINLYPNPVRNKAVLMVTPSLMTQSTSISIINQNGIVLYSRSVFNFDSQVGYPLDFNCYPSGIYFIRMVSGRKQKSLKVIVKK